jgi:hypothetical protein
VVTLAAAADLGCAVVAATIPAIVVELMKARRRG